MAKMFEKTKNFFGNLFKVGAAVAASGPAITLVGNMLSKTGTTVANPKVAAAVTKAGQVLGHVGKLVSGKVKVAAIKGGTAAAKGISTASKVLPGSKYFPLVGKIAGIGIKAAPPLMLAALVTDFYHVAKDGLAGTKGDIDARNRFLTHAPIVGGPDFGKKWLGALTARYTRKTFKDRQEEN